MGQRSRAVGLGAPIATLPGFEMLADGASRFFVQLTKTVEVEETRTNNRLTYRLKGARVAHMNNENALATMFFNTPVDSARLIPAAGGLNFIVDLRSSVTPTWKVTPAKDDSAILEIIFPKGNYLSATTAAADRSDDSRRLGDGSSPAPPATAGTPPPPRRGGGGGGGRHRGGGAPPVQNNNPAPARDDGSAGPEGD